MRIASRFLHFPATLPCCRVVADAVPVNRVSNRCHTTPQMRSSPVILRGHHPSSTCFPSGSSLALVVIVVRPHFGCFLFLLPLLLALCVCVCVAKSGIVQVDALVLRVSPVSSPSLSFSLCPLPLSLPPSLSLSLSLSPSLALSLFLCVFVCFPTPVVT